MAGPMYEVTSYETKAECEAAQQAAIAKKALSRVGPTTKQLSDGDQDTGLGPAALQPSTRPVDRTGGSPCHILGARRCRMASER
jgi:hypothetical protein